MTLIQAITGSEQAWPEQTISVRNPQPTITANNTATSARDPNRLLTVNPSPFRIPQYTPREGLIQSRIFSHQSGFLRQSLRETGFRCLLPGELVPAGCFPTV